MVSQTHTFRELKPGTPGWSVRDLDDPEIRWQWDNARYEMREGIIVSPGFGPSTATRVMPGSSGWSIHDLEKPPFREQWEEGRFELVEGVIVEMAPPALSHGYPLLRLLNRLEHYFAERDIAVATVSELDIFITEHLVFTVDGALLLPEDLAKQKAHLLEAGMRTDWVGRIHVPPSLVIESISPGRERYDYETKRGHYERFAIPNYWVLNARTRQVLCLRLQNGHYVEDLTAADGPMFRPTAFPGFETPRNALFLDL